MDIVSTSNRILRRVARLVPATSPVRLKLAAHWTSFISSRGSIAVEINGDSYTLRPEYRSFTPEYETAIYHPLKTLLAHMDCFVDVGANFGLYSLLAARVAPPDAAIVSIEANPYTYEVLRAHLELNGASGRAAAMNLAATEASGQHVRFLAEPGLAGNPCARISTAGDVGVIVATVALDDVDALRQSTRCLIKIDVEGAELGVLRGGRRTLSCDSAPILLLAVHPALLREFGASPEGVYQELARAGYCVLDEHGRAATVLEFAEYWCVPKDARDRFLREAGFERADD